MHFFGTVDFINVPFTAQDKFTAEGRVSMQKPSILAAVQREHYIFEDLISIQTTRSWDTPGLLL